MEDRKMLADLSGTNLNDAFVLNYSPATPTVEVTISTNGGAPTSLGTFARSEPFNLNGLAGNDSVEIRLADFAAYDVVITSTSVSIANGAGSLTRNSVESLKIVGTSFDDRYRFDADGPLGLISINESAGGIDTLDFSSTSSPIDLGLWISGNQVVNANLTLNLMSLSTFEDAIGGDGHDKIVGNGLNNYLFGRGGNDTLSGLNGVDTLLGGAGSDVMTGGAGHDKYVFHGAFFGAEADEVIETTASPGTGLYEDYLDFSSLETSVTLNLGSTAIQNVHTNRTLKLNSATNFETVRGGAGNDFLTGNSVRNHLFGGLGHDILVGGAGDDALYGDAGRDILIGGLGADTLYGGANDDILIGGTTSGSRHNLNAVRNKWTSTANYQDRINAIKTGPQDECLIVNVNVFHGTDVDTLSGETGTDWFFGVLYGSSADEHDRESNEAWEFW